VAGLGLLLGAGTAALRSGSASPREAKVIFVPTPPPPVTRSDTLRSGQTLGEILDAHGFDAAESYAFIQSVRRFQNPRSLRPDVVVHFTAVPGESPTRVTLELDPDRRLRLSAAGSGWTASLDSVPVVVDTLEVAGRIRSSLWESELSGEVERLAPGEFEEVVLDLSRIYAWQIDFYRDIRRGDAYRVAIEREVRPDGSIRSGRILAAEFRNAGRDLYAIPYRRPDGRIETYDLAGKALRGVFLRAPLEFRVTSGFSRRRYHPILKRFRPHLGMDYGAPRGAAVHATGAGRVTRAGRWGGYGIMVEIRHAGGIRTRYAHLSRLGVRVGQRVEQGQVIGRVGSTGLATAPHLHYEFLKNARQTNPARVKLPAAPTLEQSLRPDFEAYRDRVLTSLRRVSLPPPERTVAGARTTVD